MFKETERKQGTSMGQGRETGDTKVQSKGERSGAEQTEPQKRQGQAEEDMSEPTFHLGWMSSGWGN